MPKDHCCTPIISSNNEEVEKEVSLYPLYAAFSYLLAQLAGESTGFCFRTNLER